MTQKKRLLTYTIIVVLVLIIAWFGIPNRAFTTRGALLPTGHDYPAISLENVIFSDKTQVISGIQVGTINIEAYLPSDKDREKTITAAKDYMAQLAAQHGANHVMFILAAISNEKILIFRAKALRTD